MLYVGLWCADLHLDAAAVKRGERILQPDPELADHELGFPALLGILVLGQVLVVKAAAEVRDMPSVATLDDAWLGRAAECLLVERVGDHLADRLGHVPVIEDLLDIQVEEGRRFRRGFQAPMIPRSASRNQRPGHRGIGVPVSSSQAASSRSWIVASEATGWMLWRFL